MWDFTLSVQNLSPFALSRTKIMKRDENKLVLLFKAVRAKDVTYLFQHMITEAMSHHGDGVSP